VPRGDREQGSGRHAPGRRPQRGPGAGRARALRSLATACGLGAVALAASWWLADAPGPRPAPGADRAAAPRAAPPSSTPAPPPVRERPGATPPPAPSPEADRAPGPQKPAALVDEHGAPTPQLVRAALADALARHQPSLKLSSEELDAAASALWRLREARLELRALREAPDSPTASERRRALREAIGRASEDFRYHVEMSPAEFTALAQPGGGDAPAPTVER